MSSSTPLIGRLGPKPASHKRKLLYLAVASAAVLILLSTFSLSSTREPKEPKAPAHLPFIGEPTWDPENRTIVAAHGAVASDREVCSKLGVSILQKGGSAADAAVSTCLCIGAVDTMYSSGIGGGAFITSKKKGEPNAISIDGREMAPAGAYKDMYEGRETASKFGGLAVGIPGELKGLYALYKTHGSGNLSWAELVQPVADIARKGYPVSYHFQTALEAMAPFLETFKEDWGFVFNRDGTLKSEGQWISRPRYADTLETISQNGSDAVFYDPEGPIAPFLAASAKKWGGILTKEDFAKYEVVVEPANRLERFTERNLTVFSAAGASSGVAMLAGLAVVDGFKDIRDVSEEVAGQRLVESMKWLSSVRTHLGDVGVYNDNETSRLEHAERYAHFLSPEWAHHARSKVSDTHTNPWQDYEPAYQPNEPHGTSSLSIVDAHGNAVSITTTVNLLFGSLVHDPVTGVILNDEMDDFSVPTTKNAFDLSPSVYNYIEPYKRPLSSSSQSIVVDPETDSIDFVIGAAGGSRIPTAVLQAIVRTYHSNMDILDVIAFPRMHHQLLPEILYIERPLKPQFAAAMKSRGHTVEGTRHMTAMNGIKVTNGVKYAQSDYWRKSGCAAGY